MKCVMQEEWRVYWFRAKIWKHKYPTPCDISTWLRIRIFFTNMSLSLCTHRDGRLNKPRKFTLRNQERATSEAYTAMQEACLRNPITRCRLCCLDSRLCGMKRPLKATCHRACMFRTSAPSLTSTFIRSHLATSYCATHRLRWTLLGRDAGIHDDYRL